MAERIRNFVFDFGAVIFAWDPVARVSVHFDGDWCGYASAEALANSIFGHADWRSFDAGTLAMDQLIERTAQRLGIAAVRLAQLIEPIGEDLEPIEASVAVLAALRELRERERSVRLLFLSNMPEPYARALERRHTFLDWFDAGIFSADVKLAKPDVQIYQLLANRHSLVAQETLFIDDQRLNTQAAASLGWIGVHLQAPEELERSLRPYCALVSGT